MAVRDLVSCVFSSASIVAVNCDVRHVTFPLAKTDVRLYRVTDWVLLVPFAATTVSFPAATSPSVIT